MTAMDELAALVRRFWNEVWCDGDLDVIDEIYADPFVRHAAKGTHKRSPAQLKDDLVQYRRAMRASWVRFHDQSVDGDRVWTRLTTGGVSLHTQEPLTMAWLELHRIEDGRIAEAWVLNAPGVDWSR